MSDSLYYTQVRSDVLDLLPKNIKIKNSLDVGCGAGLTSEYLKHHIGVQHTVGIEVVPDVAEKAANKLDEVFNISVEAKDLPFEKDSFDLILFADVLEHLVDPWATLQRFAQFLKPGGIVLISLPNIQNWKILLKLFFGRWEYQDHGIMDKTHLRFFTVESAAQMAEDAGLAVKKLEQTMGRTLQVLNMLTLGLFKNHLTYHIYLLAEKRGE